MARGAPPPGATSTTYGVSRRASRRRRWPKRLVVSLCVLVVLALVGAGGAYAYLVYRVGQIPRVAVPALARSTGGPFNVLLVGSDHLNGGRRADTMVVARVDPSTQRVALLDIPYDYFATVVGMGGPNKISDALGGGPQAMVATVEHDLGIPINHYVQVGFSGVVNVVNALGGVQLDFPVPAYDKMSGLSVPTAGCQTLDGTQALALVRSRFYTYDENGSWQQTPTGDFGRIKRQDAFLRAVLQRVKASILGDPLRLNSFVSAVVHDLTVDKGLGTSTLLQMAEAFRSLGGSSLTTFTLPTQIVNTYGVYGDVLMPVPSLDRATIASWEAAVGAPPPAGAPGPPPSASAASAPPAGGGSIVTNRTTPPFDPRPC